MPIYEFKCRSCEASFDELVGPHVGKTVEDVRCPECESADLERMTASGFAPIHRQLTTNQKRRMDDKRGTDRGGAKQRFKQQRAAEKRGRPRGRGG